MPINVDSAIIMDCFVVEQLEPATIEGHLYQSLVVPSDFKVLMKKYRVALSTS
jgi:hypothetical protein